MVTKEGPEVVFLFDIDGTLIKTGGAGGDALMEAFSETFGIAKPQEVPFSGRTDRGIAQQLFQLHGVEDTQENWELLRQEYLRRLAVYLPQRVGEVLPGVAELLGALSSHSQVSIGLLTGNTREGARMKLEYYALMQHFAFGGYGDIHVNRDGVAWEALDAYRVHANGQSRDSQVWVVGDTPLDVQCARTIGARVLAVATGWHSRARLEQTNPDLLLDDLRAADTILQHTLAPPFAKRGD